MSLDQGAVQIARAGMSMVGIHFAVSRTENVVKQRCMSFFCVKKKGPTSLEEIVTRSKGGYD